MCRFESGLRHHNEIKGLGSKSLTLFCGGFWVGVHIGVHGVRFHAHQGLEFFPAHACYTALKTLMVGCPLATAIRKSHGPGIATYEWPYVSDQERHNCSSRLRAWGNEISLY